MPKKDKTTRLYVSIPMGANRDQEVGARAAIRGLLDAFNGAYPQNKVHEVIFVRDLIRMLQHIYIDLSARSEQD